jgi:hypothetical protein
LASCLLLKGVDIHTVRTRIAGGILALALAGGAVDANALPAASVGGAAYDSILSLDWQPDQTRSGKPLITGYVTTVRGLSGYCNITLSIQTLDAQGNVIANYTGFVPGYVGGDDHVYFEAPIKVAGPAYRVSVGSWLRCGGGAS